MIYQKHPVHGLHMPVTTLEATANEGNGWKTITEDEFYGKPKEEKSYNLSREELIERYEAKTGKKPHHMMKDSTIQKKLDE